MLEQQMMNGVRNQIFFSSATYEARFITRTYPLCLADSCPVTCPPDIGHTCVLHISILYLSGNHATQHNHVAM